MQRIASVMKLKQGFADEYRIRHDNIWPELQVLLKDTGINDYSIFLDESTNNLFASFKVDDPQSLASLPNMPVMKRWWTYMKDIMETNYDDSPISIPLKEVFYLP